MNAVIPAGGGSRKAPEARFFEVPVEAEGRLNPQIPHNHEARAVGEAPVLVPMGLKEVEGGLEVARVNPDRGDRSRGQDGTKETGCGLCVRFHPHERRGLVEDETRRHDRPEGAPRDLGLEPLGRRAFPVPWNGERDPRARVLENQIFSHPYR